MAKATKRGHKWRCLVFSHYEYKDGRKIRKYKSFTSDTKREAERLAAQYEYDKRQAVQDVTVIEAIEEYIAVKQSVLSSSTYQAYNAYIKGGNYDGIGAVSVCDLNQVTLQRWISNLATDHSPKYVRNIYALFSAAMRMANVDVDSIAPQLPQKEADAVNVPCDAELMQLFDYLDGPKRYDLRVACLLAAFGSLRRSEICALLPEDFDGDTVRVSKGMVRDGSGGWIVQPHAKNDTSNRIVTLPHEVVEQVDLDRGVVVDCNPDELTNRFRRAVKYAGLDRKFTLHSLRHYYVSIAHVLGIPDQYVMRMGGWRTDYVMKRTYRTTLTDAEQAEQDKLNDHFRGLCNQNATKEPKNVIK